MSIERDLTPLEAKLVLIDFMKDFLSKTTAINDAETLTENDKRLVNKAKNEQIAIFEQNLIFYRKQLNKGR
jgi:nicotinamidase-related amidase